MSLGVELQDIQFKYQKQIDLLTDIMSFTQYFMEQRDLQLKEFLGKDDVRERYQEYLNLIEWSRNQPKGTGFQVAKEHMDVHFYHKLIEETDPKKNYLMKMTLVYLFAIFEAFNKDFFFKLYSCKPELMKSDQKQMNYKEILNFTSLEELLKTITSREVDKFGRINIDKLAKILNDKFYINIEEDFEYWDVLRENYYRRNIVVHYNGKISEDYLKKMNLPPENLNEELVVDPSYVHFCSYNIGAYLDFIFNKIKEKFNLDITRLRRTLAVAGSFKVINKKEEK